VFSKFRLISLISVFLLQVLRRLYNPYGKIVPWSTFSDFFFWSHLAQERSWLA